jgi:hypothetical protein
VISLLVTLFYFVSVGADEGSLYMEKVSQLQGFAEFDLQSLKGQNSLWYFFQPDCESCRRQSKEFTCLPKNLQIFAVGVLGNKQALLKEFRNHAPRALALYGGPLWQKKLNVNQTPTLLWLNSQGIVVRRIEHKVDCVALASEMNAMMLVK